LEAAAAFVRRLQQVTSAVAAKGVEDTAFYRHVRLVALNEVGADPARFGMSVEAFHDAARDTLSRHPRTLNATATHDTKRGEDVRARLAILSQVPGEWRALVGELRRLASPYREEPVDGAAEYLLYQVLVGAHPLEADRAVEYMQKACREAKTRTSWLSPDAAYEAAVEALVRGVAGDDELMARVGAFVERIEPAATTTSLAISLLKLVSPGVPDIYQGCELWDLSLVDPDNRRPVDYARREAMLERLEAGLAPAEVLAGMAAGLPKLHLIREGLALRRRRPGAFGPGSTYAPLPARGAAAANVIALTRGDPDPVCVAVAPRFATRTARGWSATTLELPGAAWRDVLTGAEVGASAGVEELLADFPVALLEAVG
ncbi:MAG: (1-_4)-alpha-D-glucan 1-alpha-D-glucosylmutase, partial [Chloroflexota bacterium]|nr:(1->4)-alpha-D-glucan 1-alpha-D-glucosylmutase [Chloroflexota bacterium]